MDQKIELAEFQKLYLQNDFVGAKKWLESHKSEFSSGVYHYNLGTILFKLSELPSARYHFEMALQSGLYTSATLKNLETVKSELQVREFESPENFLDHWYYNGASISTGSLSSIFFIVIGLGIILNYFKKISKKTFILLIVLGFLPLGIKYFCFRDYSFVIAVESQGVFEGPSKIFSKSSTPPAGSRLIIRDHNEEWVEVVSPVKSAGWIQKKLFKSLHLP